jgi:hypothetical protein
MLEIEHTKLATYKILRSRNAKHLRKIERHLPLAQSWCPLQLLSSWHPSCPSSMLPCWSRQHHCPFFFSRSSRLRFSQNAFPCNYLHSVLRSSRATETRIHCLASDLLQRLFSCNRVKSLSKPLVKHCLPRSVAFRYFLSTGVRVSPPGYLLAFFWVTNARHRRCRTPCTETAPSVRFTPSWNRACGVFEIPLPSSRSHAPLQKVSCRRAKTTRRRRGTRGTGNE